MQEKLFASEVVLTELKVFLIPLRKDKGQQHTQTDLEQQTEASLSSELQSSPNLGLPCKWFQQAPLKHL
jgi:hypothetical protein